MQQSHLLADLRDATEDRGGFFADKSFAQRFMLRPEHPGRQSYQRKERNCNEEFPLHAPPSNVLPATRMEGALFAAPATQQMTLFNAPASPAPPKTPIVLTLVMIPRGSS